MLCMNNCVYAVPSGSSLDMHPGHPNIFAATTCLQRVHVNKCDNAKCMRLQPLPCRITATAAANLS